MTAYRRRTVCVATTLACLAIALTVALTPGPAWGGRKTTKTKTTKSAKAREAAKAAAPKKAAAAEAPEATFDPSATPDSREFLFTYQATVTGLEPGQVAKVWLPVPPSNEDQSAAIVAQDLPGRSSIGREGKYGNLIMFVEAPAGEDGTVPVSVTYHVRRREVSATGEGARLARASMDAQAELFLQPDAKVPVGGKALTLIEGKELPDDPMERARTLYDVVEGHMKYSKEGKGWGNGDSDWACDSRFGNCTDFHSLFISLSRAQEMPAKFEIGFSVPQERGRGEIGGYHCWAKVMPASGLGWVPVDISEADKHPEMREYYFGNLTADRVTFSTGRDLTLVPEQAGPPLNFFIYPYVEVDGQPLPADRVQRKFGYEDVGPETAAAPGTERVAG